jgi:hypothetical protein
LVWLLHGKVEAWLPVEDQTMLAQRIEHTITDTAFQLDALP